jgi:hypothetical protein
MHPERLMSAIAPPPVGADAEPSVVSDNASAIPALRKTLRNTRSERRDVAPRKAAAKRALHPASLAVLLVVGVAAAMFGGRRSNSRRR